MSARLELKIFLSSPGDVSDERGLARRVLDRLSQEYGLRDRVHLEEVSWDDPGAPVPLDAHLTPQEAINNRRPKPSQCDVVVVTLWSRMGSAEAFFAQFTNTDGCLGQSFKPMPRRANSPISSNASCARLFKSSWMRYPRTHPTARKERRIFSRLTRDPTPDSSTRPEIDFYGEVC